MIIGIGTDIVSITRIRVALDRHGAQFAQRVLSDAELLALNDVKDPAPWLAKRWAAKEAFGKAAGSGVRAPLTLAGIGVGHNAAGQPQFEVNDAIAAHLRSLRVARTHLTLSDERDVAVAFVVFESS
ncbi:MAG: holo-ACP synthase [Burkholderiales bacterium]|nr:holo-ACP synthase [Burkholderiales bacterium]